MLTNYRKVLDGYLVSYQLAKQQVKEERQRLSAARDKVEYTTQAQKLVQEVAEAVQQSAHRSIASVVTRCLEAVFGEEAYEFRIAFSQKRGKTEADLVFVRDGKELDPTSSAGGGVIDVASFALRLACLMLSRPSRRRLLVLDEPMRMLSSDHHAAVRTMLLELATELDTQFIMVTHHSGLRAGKVIELG